MAACKLAMVAVMAMASVMEVALGKDYTKKWAVGIDYDGWASSITFFPGDTLTFMYSSPDNVMEVTPDEYAACNHDDIISEDSSGKTVVALTMPGTRYFICGFQVECILGQRVQINVVSPDSLPPSPGPASTSAASGLPVRDGHAKLMLGLGFLLLLLLLLLVAF